MSEKFSAKYYQGSKERLLKKGERYQNLSIEEKERSDNMIVSVTKIFQKMKK